LPRAYGRYSALLEALNEVMELAYDSKLAKQLELFEQRCGSELSFEHTGALAVQSSFDEQVYVMA
jgi:hypothetical protein